VRDARRARPVLRALRMRDASLRRRAQRCHGWAGRVVSDYAD